MTQALNAPLPEEAQTALDRLKDIRAGAGRGSALLQGIDGDTRQRRREALAKQLRQLTEQVRMLKKLLDPKSAAGEAARLARQIAAVARALADLSQPERGGSGAGAAGVPPQVSVGSPLPASPDPLPQQTASSGKEIREELLAGIDMRPAADRQRMRDLLERYGVLAPAPDKAASLWTISVRDVLLGASDTIQGLKAMIERAHSQTHPHKPGASRHYRHLADEAGQAARAVRALAQGVDPLIRVSRGAEDQRGLTI